jgi:hypothetical protein
VEIDYFTIILCGAVFIGVGIPAGIYLLARRRKGLAEFDVFAQLMSKSRQAWRADEGLMQELSQAVSVLRGESELSGETDSTKAVDEGSSLTRDV